MSQNINYSVYTQHLDAHDIFHATRRLALHLAGYWASGKPCFERHNTIANKIGCCTKTVQRAYKALAEIGFIHRQDRFIDEDQKGAGQQLSCVYYPGELFADQPEVPLSAPTDVHPNVHPINLITLKHRARVKAQCEQIEIAEAAECPDDGSTVDNVRTVVRSSVRKWPHADWIRSRLQKLGETSDGLLEATLSMVDRRRETGLDERGREIRNPFKYVNGMIENWVHQPYERQEAFRDITDGVWMSMANSLPGHAQAGLSAVESDRIPF